MSNEYITKLVKYLIMVYTLEYTHNGKKEKVIIIPNYVGKENIKLFLIALTLVLK